MQADLRKALTALLTDRVGLFFAYFSAWTRRSLAAGTMAAITPFDWLGLALICIVLPAVLSFAFGQILRKIGWIKEGDLKLESADKARSKQQD